MQVNILTLFPEMFQGPLSESLLKRAQEKNLLAINVVDLRAFTSDKHKTADDSPYGGGAGMVMKADIIAAAIDTLNSKSEIRKSKLILMCPTGKPLSQEKAIELSKLKQMTVLCGRYEGIDERVRAMVDEEISIGDYILTGGEIPAMVLIDAVVRQIPGVVKEKDSLENDSFFDDLLDYPSYTKPEEFEGGRVPGVLLSGHHAEIARWRRQEALRNTLYRRPDLLAKAQLTSEDRALLTKICQNG